LDGLGSVVGPKVGGSFAAVPIRKGMLGVGVGDGVGYVVKMLGDQYCKKQKKHDVDSTTNASLRDHGVFFGRELNGTHPTHA